jgi:5-methylcytosine-specific restriction protein A
VANGRCDEHRRAHNRERERVGEYRDKPWRSIYKTRRWQGLTKIVRREEPFCRMKCERPTEEVDHIVGLADGGPPFDRQNLQGMCHICHSRKTMEEVRRRGNGGRPNPEAG